jgi:sarcosine oxidase subunit alpha
VTLGRLDATGMNATSTERLHCDALAVSGGFSPALHLYAQGGGRLAYEDASGALVPTAPLPGVEILGAAAERVITGARASPVGDPKRQWVDLLHDVTVADLRLALRENFTNVEHVKRYTTVGMAADQGKTSAPAALGILARERDLAAREIGYTTMRPPVQPVTLGAIAGRELGPRFAPFRRLALHDWHVTHGGLMQDFGEWSRAVAYVLDGETREQAAQREARAVRAGVGLLDASSLGKIEVRGPDALEFLDRFYINDLSTLKPWRARYGLMLRESGIIFDDGTVVLAAPDRLILSTTSSNAGAVARWLEEWHQCEWPQLKVAIVPMTDAWATLTLAGPRAREVLAQLRPKVDITNEAFPHMSVRETTLLGAPARICRVSFTGELSYEINVPTPLAQATWGALLAAGGSHGIQPLGLDALMQLRLEKGYVDLGTDTDGTTVPDDIGFGTVAANKKSDFIGSRSLRLPEYRRTDRLQLVGLSGAERAFVLGSHLRVTQSKAPTDGWVTSAGPSVQHGEPLALAMVRAGRSRVGQRVTLYDAGRVIGTAEIARTPFYDPSGVRMHA